MDTSDLAVFEKLANSSRDELTADERRSIAFYRAHRSLGDGHTDSRVTRWLLNAAELQTHVQLQGRLPAPQDEALKSLLTWIKNQRRNKSLCDFQIAFLNSIPRWT